MDRETEKNGLTVSIGDIFKIIKSGFVMILIVTILFTIGGGLYAILFKKTTYTAEARVQIYMDPSSYNELSENQEKLAAYSRFQFSTYIVNMTVEIMKSGDMMKKVKEKMSEKGLTIGGTFSFSTTENNPSFSVMYEMKSREDKSEECATILNEYLQDVIEVISEAEDEATVYVTDSNGNSVKKVNATKYGWLKSSMICVYSDASVSVNKGTVVVLVIAFFAGFIISFLIAFIIYVSDDTIKSKEQVEELTGVGVIAFIEYTEIADGEVK